MKAVLELELIGDDAYEGLRLLERGRLGREPSLHEYIRLLSEGRERLRPWVARLAGLDERYGFKRQFVRFQHKDFSRANSVGSRGVYAYYILDPGLYEVNERVNWKRQRRYFLRVHEDGSKAEVSEDEVRECLRSAC